MKKKFRVYFAQVNQTFYDVEAKDREAAKLKAARLWMLDTDPVVIAVEEQKESEEA